MKRSLFTFLLLGLSVLIMAQTKSQRPKIGVVLSGGGAKGFAHVGVLKVLEEAKIPIDYIAGTSIGAIIGGLYACGYDAATLEKIVKGQDWNSLLSNEYKSEFITPFDQLDESRYNVSFPFEEKKLALSNGILNGQNAMELISFLTIGFHDVYDFSKLPTPFLCIATDLTNGQEVVLDKGYIAKAIRASMSIPVAFTSTEINGQMLVDGGIVNNYPADRCREMGADKIIGVDIMDSLMTNEDIKGIPQVVSQMINFMGQQRSMKNAKEVDIYIRPYIRGYSAASFSAESAEALIKRGEDAARRVLPQLIRLRDSLGVFAKPRTIHKEINKDTTLVISQIEVTGTDRAKIAFYLGQTGIKRDQHVTLEHLKNGISRLYSTGNYEYVNYQLVGAKKKTLKVEVKERKNNKINAGLHYDSEMKAAMLVNITLRNQNFFGSRFSMDAKLSQFPMFAGQYSIDRGWKPGFFSKLMYVSDRFYRYKAGNKTAEIDMSLLNLKLAGHSFITDATRFTLGTSMDYYNLTSAIGDTSGYHIKDKVYFNLFAKIEHSRLNKIYFPTKGTNISGGAKLLLNNGFVTPVLLGDFYFKRARSISDRITLLYTINSRLVFGDNESYFHRTFLGGVQQTDYMENNVPFNGLHRMEINTASVGTARLEARLRMWEKIYVSLTGDIGMYTEDKLFLSNQKTIYGFGLNAAYDSAVGPLEFNMSLSSIEKDLIPFLSLGYWF
ncbi:MAG: patatin-like phospholipase family protein [Prolixibacteraceae bacterium]